MSTQRQRRTTSTTVSTLNEDTVADFLEGHPEFFERHPALLAQLKLPHKIGGSAVSLVERQVSILRQRNRKLDRKLRELVSVARINEKLASKIHKLSLNLIASPDLESVVGKLEGALRQDFGADESVMVLFEGVVDKEDLSGLRFLRCVGANDDRLRPFQTFLTGARPRCGQMRDAQREFLFGRDNVEIGSAALVPLGQKSRLGLLAIGSKDSGHFHPAMSTDFLTRLSDIVAAALGRHLPVAA